MRAMILAAGRGERMGALTANTPKPLLRIAGHYLIEHSLFALQRAGISEVVINVAYLGQKIMDALGDGSQYNMSIAYSVEPERLETGGGITKALPLLGDEPFIVLSADVVCDYHLLDLPSEPLGMAHLVLVENPDFHPEGDFGLSGAHVDRSATPTYTFANIAVYRPELFQQSEPVFFPLSQLLLPAIDRRQVTGEVYRGLWYNIGNEQQLQAVENLFSEQALS